MQEAKSIRSNNGGARVARPVDEEVAETFLDERERCHDSSIGKLFAA